MQRHKEKLICSIKISSELNEREVAISELKYVLREKEYQNLGVFNR